MCINDARRRWRWYTAVVQNTIAKKNKEKRWIKFLRGILDETRETLDKAVKDTAEFNQRMGLSEGAALFTSGPGILDRMMMYQYEDPSHDDQIGKLQIIMISPLPDKTLSELEKASRSYLWNEFSMDSRVDASRGSLRYKREAKKSQRKARSKRKAFDRMLKKARDARLKQHENALRHKGQLCSKPIQETAPPHEEVRYELPVVMLRPNEHPDDVVAQRVIDDACRRWHWYTSLLKAMQSEHPDKIDRVEHLSQMVQETKAEYDSAVAATNEFNAQMGISNVSAHKPTVHVLMFWKMLYEQRMNNLDELRSQYCHLQVCADQFSSGNNDRFRRYIRQAHELKAIFDDYLLRARSARIRKRAG